MKNKMPKDRLMSYSVPVSFLHNYVLTMFVVLGCSQAPKAQTETKDTPSNAEESIDKLMQQDKEKFLKISFKKYLTKVGILANSPMQNEYESLQSGNLYSNYYFNLTIDLPDHWEVDRGVSEYTLIRAFQSDSGITIHLNVQPLLDKFEKKDGSNPNTLSHWDSLHNGDYAGAITYLLKSQGGADIEDLTISETKIGVNEFIVTTYRFKQYYDNEEYYMKTSTYQSVMFNTTYTVSYSAPEFIFDTNIVLSVLNRFKVLNPKFGHSKK